MVNFMRNEEQFLGPFDMEGELTDYGWRIDFGKRVRWNSRKATSRMWPHIFRGTDEVCNRALTLVLWPLGSLIVWWEPHWRTTTCDECKAFAVENDLCPVCMCRPCWCTDPQ